MNIFLTDKEAENLRELLHKTMAFVPKFTEDQFDVYEKLTEQLDEYAMHLDKLEKLGGHLGSCFDKEDGQLVCVCGFEDDQERWNDYVADRLEEIR